MMTQTLNPIDSIQSEPQCAFDLDYLMQKEMHLFDRFLKRLPETMDRNEDMVELVKIFYAGRLNAMRMLISLCPEKMAQGNRIEKKRFEYILRLIHQRQITLKNELYSKNAGE